MSPPVEKHCPECGHATASDSDWCHRCRRQDRKDMLLLSIWWMAPAIVFAGFALATIVGDSWPAWIGLLAALVWLFANRRAD
ncbi:MAG: hypothetical protein JNM56_37480 [Planctomycetia bacterium]|nr:hypothetical protein [Planctomycetia bacterium]